MADPTQAGPDLRGPGAGRGARSARPYAQRREQRDAPPGKLRPVRCRSRSPCGSRHPIQGPRRHPSPFLAWTDAGSRGYELLIEDGKLSVGSDPLLAGQCDRDQDPRSACPSIGGPTSRSDLRRLEPRQRPGPLRRRPRAEARSCATSSPRPSPGGGNDEITIGQRFRDRGFKNGLVDELEGLRPSAHAAGSRQLYEGTDARARPGARPASSYSRPASGRICSAYYLANFDAEYQASLAALTDLRKQRQRSCRPGGRDHGDEGAAAAAADIRADAEARTTLRRSRVERDTPAALPPFSADWPRNRLGLAQWLTDPKHPLDGAGDGQSLVAVALRPWHRGDARGLRQSGPAPLAPRAARLAGADASSTRGWDVKGLLRQIVTSATYRQSSDASTELLAKDPENILLARGPRLRLPAEMIRDNALAASGLLVDKIGGPPVKPYQPAGLWEEKSGTCLHPRPRERASHRRSLYTFWKRTSPPPAMLTFDATTPRGLRRQAADDGHPASGPRAAQRSAVRRGGPGACPAGSSRGGLNRRDRRAAFVLRSLTAPCPATVELLALEALYHEQYDEFRSGRSDAQKLLAVGDAPRDADLDPAELRGAHRAGPGAAELRRDVMKR